MSNYGFLKRFFRFFVEMFVIVRTPHNIIVRESLAISLKNSKMYSIISRNVLLTPTCPLSVTKVPKFIFLIYCE